MLLFSYAFDSNCKLKFGKCFFQHAGRDFVFWVGDDIFCEVIQTLGEHENQKEEIFQTINQFLHQFGYANKCGFHFRGSSCCTVGSSCLTDIKKDIFHKRAPRYLSVKFEHISKEPTHSNGKKALALLNDAEFSHDVYHKFLCYWRIISLEENGLSWIEANKERFRGFSFYDDLLHSGVDIPKFFTDQCRNALTHVNRGGKKEIYSFSLEDYYHIQSACFSIEPFVKAYIREEIGVPDYPVPIERCETEE